MDYTAIGDTTNLAAAPADGRRRPGTILISDATASPGRAASSTMPHGAAASSVKGKREPVVAYEVRGCSDADDARSPIAEARGLTPLVGRHEELAQLASPASTGSAGMLPQVVDGRRRRRQRQVAPHLRAQAAARGACRSCSSRRRCSAMTQSVPYAPWVADAAAILRHRQRRRRGRGLRARSPPALGGDARVISRPAIPRSCQVMNLRGAAQRSEGPEDETVKRETFEAVSDLVYTEPASRPRWSWSSRTCIGSTSRRARCSSLAVGKTNRSRVMMLISHRPEHQPAWRVKSAFTQLTLGPLSDDETVEIVRGVGRRLAPGAARSARSCRSPRATLLHRGDHPHAGRGRLPRCGATARFVSTRPVDEIRMPGTVEELIGARLDRLGPQAKRVVAGRRRARAPVPPRATDQASRPRGTSTCKRSSPSSRSAGSSIARAC
mgnify:CR=1 FL=1